MNIFQKGQVLLFGKNLQHRLQRTGLCNFFEFINKIFFLPENKSPDPSYSLPHGHVNWACVTNLCSPRPQPKWRCNQSTRNNLRNGYAVPFISKSPHSFKITQSVDIGNSGFQFVRKSILISCKDNMLHLFFNKKMQQSNMS